MKQFVNNQEFDLVSDETIIHDFIFKQEYRTFNLWNYKGLYNICFHKNELPKPITKEGDIINESENK